MICSIEQKAVMIESYFRNVCKINGKWSYSLQYCLEKFRVQFPLLLIINNFKYV
ncbi:hypothetical protein BDFB_015282 [Asbolus verrucosus]|uniref:Uncharacterized protein n=1 Tax=Asbolus verrucosus TaxID=1661398 RepID=A0A482VVM9_ASBVE|nr:hypothetical protein BDFB_015282 [Asbolus verrucosus]